MMSTTVLETCSFRILLPFFRISWCDGILNSAIFTVFTIGLSLARFWRAFRISGGFEYRKTPPRYATAHTVSFGIEAVSPMREASDWPCHPRHDQAVGLYNKHKVCFLCGTYCLKYLQYWLGRYSTINPSLLFRKKCLKVMVDRIQAMRAGLKERLQKLGTPGNWDHITNQIGMFSYLGLTRKFTFTAAFTDPLHIWDDNVTGRGPTSSPRKHPDQQCNPPRPLFCSFEVPHPRSFGSITKNFCVLHIQSNTTI